MKLSVDDLSKLDIRTLRNIVSEQGKKLNKRIKRISKLKDTLKTAVNEVKKSGGTFKVSDIRKGTKNERKQLIAEAVREQQFNSKKSSTVRGAKAEKDYIIKKVTGKSQKEYKAEKRDEFKKAEFDKIASKQKKPTKAQNRRINRQAEDYAEEQSKIRNTRIGEAWETFHKWKEAHPVVGYSKDKVKNTVNEYAENDEPQQSLNNVFDSFTGVPDDLQYDVWQTVDEDIPFK